MQSEKKSKKKNNISTIQDSRQWTNYGALLSKDCRYHFRPFSFILTGSTNFMVSFINSCMLLSLLYQHIGPFWLWKSGNHQSKSRQVWGFFYHYNTNALTFHSHFADWFSVRLYRMLFCTLIYFVWCRLWETLTEMTVNVHADYDAWITASSTKASANIHFFCLFFICQETTRYQPFSQLETVSTESLLNIATISNLS